MARKLRRKQYTDETLNFSEAVKRNEPGQTIRDSRIRPVQEEEINRIRKRYVDDRLQHKPHHACHQYDTYNV